MAKGKKEVIEEAEGVEPTHVWVDVEPQEVEVVEIVESIVQEVEEAPKEAPQYAPKDIVEFYNNSGELRYAPYAYIIERGYTALRKYTKK